MKIKTRRIFFSTIIFLALASCTYSQQLSQVTFSDASNLSYLSVITDQGVLIRITTDGKLLEYGTELQSIRSNNYYDPKLQPYIGRVDNYGSESDSAFRGKVKTIGTCAITYYSHYDESTKAGKLKSIGTLILDYYSNYDNAAFRGKLRFLGSSVLEYYSSLDDEAYRGKLKSIGNTPIVYYSTFDDKLIKGKIKSIGSVAYTWYTSFDRPEFRGAMKTGSYRANIGSVTYILR
jgi:hypothetical protein